MQEILEGVGQLEQWEHPDRKHEVRFRFKITTEILQRAGFPPVVTKRYSQGAVESTVSDVFPEGEYRLYTDAEVLKVKNSGFGHWAILAS